MQNLFIKIDDGVNAFFESDSCKKSYDVIYVPQEIMFPYLIKYDKIDINML